MSTYKVVTTDGGTAKTGTYNECADYMRDEKEKDPNVQLRVVKVD